MATVGEAFVRIIPDASGFAAGLKDDVDGALKGIEKSVAGVGDKIKDEFEAPLEDTKKKVKGVGEEFKALGKLIGAAAVGRAVVNFAKDSISAASDLSESINAVQVTFGDLSDEILAFSENSAKAVGLSSADFNSFAVRFAGFTKIIATDGKNAAVVTDELTTRIADFASVMNLDLNDAATVFASTLAGESEAIRRFGIDMSAASVEAYALESGLIASKDEMNASIKVQAIYGKLMRDTAQVAGDFANTSDGLANQQRILKAQFEDLQANIGSAMIPVLQSLIGVIQPVVNGFMALPDPIQQLIAIAGLAAGGFWAMSTAIQAVGVSAAVANPIIAGIAVALGAVAFTYQAVTRGAKEAKREQDEMVAALKGANDPTWTLIGTYETFIKAMEQTADATDATSQALTDVGNAAKIVSARVVEFLGPIDQAGVSIEDLSEIALDGSDSFEDLFGKIAGFGKGSQDLSSVLGPVQRAIKAVTDEGDPLRQILLDLAANSGMTLGEFRELLKVLDSSADGFDQARKAANDHSQAILENETFIATLIEALGADYVSALISSRDATADAAGRSDEWTLALENVNTELENNGLILDPVTKKIVELDSAEGRAAQKTRNLADETANLNDELEEQEKRLKRAIDATIASFSTEIQLQRAKRDTSDAMAEYDALLQSVTDGTYAGEDATRDLAVAAEDMFLAAQDQAAITAQLAKEQLIANGVSEDAIDTNALYKGALEQLAGTLAPGSPLRVQLDGYIRTLNNVPKNISTTVRTIYETTTKTGATGTNLSRQFGARANGGIITAPELSWIGEAGPEVVIPLTRPQRAMELMRQSGLDSFVQARGGKSATVNIESANFYDGTDANLVAQKVNAAERARSFST